MKHLMEQWRKYLNEDIDVEDIAQELGIELDIYSEPSGILNLSRIVVPKDLRGQGLGSSAMKKIIRYADENDKTIALTPSTDFGGIKSRLIKFYKQFGFIMNKGKNKDYRTRELMIREPQ
jgi:GNAT superfamily N-acetyltransferase